ncbi:hypothetical protein E2C01_036882 [Portunus trituberculatus]|uniref:Uncharacterized protein n=1 Tax=Portunus trituberculatus TaxID=210409 RepID=A0A5B7F7V7_PORTR|nr:hypothetical protein [Portunus trituberculatus]
MDEAAALHMIYGPDGLCLTGDLRACSPMTPVDWRRDHACHIYLMPRLFTVSRIKVSRCYDTKMVAGLRFGLERRTNAGQSERISFLLTF